MKSEGLTQESGAYEKVLVFRAREVNRRDRMPQRDAPERRRWDQPSLTAVPLMDTISMPFSLPSTS